METRTPDPLLKRQSPDSQDFWNLKIRCRSSTFRFSVLFCISNQTYCLSPTTSYHISCSRNKTIALIYTHLHTSFIIIALVIVGSITLDCRNGYPDPMSEAFLQMAGVFSQLELAIIRTRVRSGMANAKAKGKQIGRPQTTKDAIPATFLRHYPSYKNGHLNLSEFARVCDLSRTTVYKYLFLSES